MRFLKGDSSRLQGKAIIFLELRDTAQFTEEPVRMQLFAVFCAVTELDLLELITHVMHMPREHARLITRFYKRYFQEIEEIKRSFPGRVSRIIDEIIEQEQEEVPGPTLEAFREMFRRSARGQEMESESAEEAENSGENEREEDKTAAERDRKLPEPDFYSTMIPLPGREMLEHFILASTDNGFEFDIIDLERTEHLEVANLVLDGHSRLYVADYMNQKEKEIEIPEHREYISPYKNYREISREEFKNNLSDLSSELMFLLETGESTGRVFADLKKLTSGSFLMREVVNMYNISTTRDPNRIRLMDLYFRKIFSLIDEDYLKTKQIEEKIQQYRV